MKHIIHVSIIVLLSFSSGMCERQLSYEQVLEYVYNRTNRYHPYLTTGKTVDVGMSMSILNLHALREDSMELEMDMYWRLSWKERFKLPDNSGWDGGVDIVDLENIWFPDVFITNSREVTMHKTYLQDALLRIYPDGKMFASTRMTIKTKCDWDLSAFPFDNPICDIIFQSYKGTVEWMNMSFIAHGVQVSQETNPTFFQLTKKSNWEKVMSYSVGNFQSLGVKLHFKRITNHYILFIYLPSSLLVFLSALMFWIPTAALMERTTYSTLLLLAMLLVSSCAQYAVPQVGYVKAIDTWCATCTFFLFAATTEVMLLHLLRMRQKQQTNVGSFHEMKEESEEPSDTASRDTRGDTSLLAGKLAVFRNPAVVQWIDVVFRIVYPTAFLIFIIVYASRYH